MEILLPIAIVGLVLAFVAMTLRRWDGRIQSTDPAVRPGLSEYRTHLAAISSNHHPRWTDCPVCACPTIDESTDWRACELCDWEVSDSASHEELREAELRFRRHGSVSTPEEMAAWQGRPPSAGEIALRHSMAELCSAVRSGELALPEWSEQWEQHRAELSDLTLRRSEGDEPARDGPA